MKTYLALSGGADSSTLLAYLLDKSDEVYPTFFEYGQRHHAREVHAATEICRYYGLRLNYLPLQLPAVGALSGTDATPAHEDVVGHPQPPTYVPMRNLIIASYLASLAEAGNGRVALGVHRSDTYGYWDTTPEFILRLQSLLSLSRGTHQVNIIAPFQRLTKTNIINWGVDHNVPYELTWSCYAGRELHCGVCSTCVERRASFKHLGLEDPRRYER